MQYLKIFICALTLFCLSCETKKHEESGPFDVNKEIENTEAQYLVLKSQLTDGTRFPQTFDKSVDKLVTSDSNWWCSGFYPGTLLYLYELTGNQVLLKEAQRMLALLEPQQYNTGTHDIGFMMYCSFGNANRLTRNLQYESVLVNSANSLITRFNPNVGCIRSHDRGPNDFVVIIDNMMNLELLFWATRETGDSTYYKIAVSHADTTLKNHFRADYSAYHGINYNPQTGEVQAYQAGQGYSEKSAWARGQAWAVYGYTMVYRETHDSKYLDQAVHIADFILNNTNLPKDKIPYWDFDAPNIPDELRDASSAAIMSSGLLELSEYVDANKSAEFFDAAKEMLTSLSLNYKSAKGGNGGFILDHSVGNMPAQKEIDVPLSYADYYYVEALERYQRIMEGK